MNQKAFTIHTQLIDGSLEGARNIYMGANRTCHLYVLPRSEVSLANSIEDISKQWAFYILLGKDEDCNCAYIGQTSDFANRKNDHIQKKPWWHTALVFISDNGKIYGDDVKFLEYLGIKKAEDVGSYRLLNSTTPRRPNIAPHQVNDMENFFKDIVLLTNFYGCQIFSMVDKTTEKRHIFYVKAGGDRPANGSGFYDEASGNFTILRGSEIAPGTAKSFNQKDRNEIINKKCKIIDGKIILQEDIVKDSPSGASCFVLGRSSNGWIEWVDADGVSLKNYYNSSK